MNNEYSIKGHGRILSVYILAFNCPYVTIFYVLWIYGMIFLTVSHRDLPASASGVWELKAFATTPNCNNIFKRKFKKIRAKTLQGIKLPIKQPGLWKPIPKLLCIIPEGFPKSINILEVADGLMK